MHVPDEVTPGAGQPVAIAGAALRFPGASDPFSIQVQQEPDNMA